MSANNNLAHMADLADMQKPAFTAKLTKHAKGKGESSEPIGRSPGEYLTTKFSYFSSVSWLTSPLPYSLGVLGVLGVLGGSYFLATTQFFPSPTSDSV
jgi:hypothetical protein